MKNYYRIRLGTKGNGIAQCLSENFVGVDFSITEDLSKNLFGNIRDFRDEFIPVYMNCHPGKSKIAAGLACGTLWALYKGFQTGDIIISPDSNGNYHLGEVIGDYKYASGLFLPHRREVRWFNQSTDLTGLTEPLKNNLRAPGTVRELTYYKGEIEALLDGGKEASIITQDKTIEDPIVFALEKHLEEFLVSNWKSTPLGEQYDLYEIDGEMIGQQFSTDTGNLDILAISKDKNTLLVIELKKGRASDSVVGQIQRYMGYIQEELAEENQVVRGVIIALEDDKRIRRSLAVAPNIDFYRYQVNFTLEKI